MQRMEFPEDYEDRLAEGRRAAARLRPGPVREAAERALAAAPDRERYERAAALADRAAALVEDLTGRDFDGSDPDRVAWLRLDCTGRLRSLALSPTIDRLSNRAVAEAIEAAWTAAEAARSEQVLRLERTHADLLAGRVPDRRGDEIRDLVAGSAERFAHTDEDDLCTVEVNLEGRLTGFGFLVPNATLDVDCEALSARAAAAVRIVQERAAARFAALVEGVR
jgi:hypothetical protein